MANVIPVLPTRRLRFWQTLVFVSLGSSGIKSPIPAKPCLLKQAISTSRNHCSTAILLQTQTEITASAKPLPFGAVYWILVAYVQPELRYSQVFRYAHVLMDKLPIPPQTYANAKLAIVTMSVSKFANFASLRAAMFLIVTTTLQ